MANIDLQNRAPAVTRTPDFRNIVTRRYDVLNWIPKTPADILAECWQPLGTVDDEYDDCYLIEQRVEGQTGDYYSPCKLPPVLVRVFLELDGTNETQQGEPSITYDEDGNINVEINWFQLASGTAVNLVVGTQTAPAPYSSAILKEQIATNDGTLRRIKRIYNGNRTLSDVQNLRFGGKVIVRTITAIGAIPPTPSGFTLVGPGVLHPDGREIYTYEFAAAAGSGGTPGTSGQISQSFTNNQGGEIAFDVTNPDGATGEVICVTTYVSPQTTTVNPVTQPTGFVLWAVDVQDEAGYRLWTTKSGFGGGEEISVEVRGLDDGALLYTVSQNDADGSTVPAYPGSGTAYNTSLTHARDNGFWRNVAVWQKPPASQTRNETIQFEKPGVAEFTGSPPQFLLTAPRTLTILASVVVDYATTQISDVPFTVEAPAAFYEAYTPTDTGVAVTDTQALGRYLAQASGISGTNSNYNGILCNSWSAQLISSVPSTFPTGATVLRTDNTPYLTDINGVVVWKREKISYTF